ncbi:hypothetical protein [Pseudomonas sp. 22 E 5]|nr:hypothetical protein [Pseudomonas sp. 22 E 5]
MQCGVATPNKGEGIQCAGEAQHRFNVSLDVKEVHSVAALCPAFRQTAATHHASQHRLLLQAVQLTDETQAAFEHAYTILLTVQVMGQRLHQARPQRRTHGGHVVGDRVGQQQWLDAWAEQFELLRIDEAVGHRFLVTTSHQQATQLRQMRTRLGLGLRCQARLRITNRQAVVAVQTGQLFDQIDFQADIEAMAWHFDLPLPFPARRNAKAEGRQQLLDFGRLNHQTQHLLNALGAQSDRCYRRQVLFADGFGDRASFATGDFQQQTSGALHGFTGQLPVHATLVAVRCIGVQAIGTGLASDGDLVEKCAFKEHVTGGCGHTAVLATHHAGNRQGTGVVGDDQGVSTQADFLTVKQHQLLAFFGHAYADATVDFGKIERMQRLAQLQHDVVGDIYGSIDAAHVRATQTLDHPQRSWLGQINVTDHTPQITWAGVWCQHFNRTHFVVHSSYAGNHRTGHRSVVQRAHFTGKASQRQAIAAVRGQVDLDAGIFQFQVNADVLAHRRVARQFHQAIIPFAYLQLRLGAQHAVGFDATQLSLLDLEVARQFSTDHGKRNLQARAHVGSSAHDLEGLRAIADLAYAQFIGVRVLLGAQHFAHDHATENTGGRCNTIDLKAGHRQTRNQRVAIHLRAYPAAQPLFTEFHPALLKIRYD